MALQMFKAFKILFLQKFISMGILWFNSFAVYQCCQSFYITYIYIKPEFLHNLYLYKTRVFT